jgi:hypothetical protein
MSSPALVRSAGVGGEASGGLEVDPSVSGIDGFLGDQRLLAPAPLLSLTGDHSQRRSPASDYALLGHETTQPASDIPLRGRGAFDCRESAPVVT